MIKFGPFPPHVVICCCLALLDNKSARAKDASGMLSPRQQAHSAPPPAKNTKRIVMIDPGHGGIDSGVVGKEGSEEKCGDGNC